MAMLNNQRVYIYMYINILKSIETTEPSSKDITSPVEDRRSHGIAMMAWVMDLKSNCGYNTMVSHGMKPYDMG